MYYLARFMCLVVAELCHRSIMEDIPTPEIWTDENERAYERHKLHPYMVAYTDQYSES